MLLLAQQGFTPQIRRCFVAYLAAHNRPPHEVLFGPMTSMADSFNAEFLALIKSRAGCLDQHFNETARVWGDF